MHYLKNTTWEAVYQSWRQREGSRPEWQEFARGRGFADWAAWRDVYIQAAHLPDLSWSIFHIEPKEFLSMKYGAFHGWLARAEQAGSRLLRDLAVLPEWDTHGKVQCLLADFPRETEFIGLRRGDELFLFEGHHRAIALCKLIADGADVCGLQLRIALADIPTDSEYPLVDFCPDACQPR